MKYLFFVLLMCLSLSFIGCEKKERFITESLEGAAKEYMNGIWINKEKHYVAMFFSINSTYNWDEGFFITNDTCIKETGAYPPFVLGRISFKTVDMANIIINQGHFPILNQGDTLKCFHKYSNNKDVLKRIHFLIIDGDTLHSIGDSIRKNENLNKIYDELKDNCINIVFHNEIEAKKRLIKDLEKCL